MATIQDVPSQELVKAVAAKLHDVSSVQPPVWAPFVKTGSHALRKPDYAGWWFVRAASMLRQVYIHGEVGVSRLRTRYGGRKRKGVKPEHHARSGGKAIRLIFQQLEKAGFVKKVDKVGRTLTPQGQSLLDKTALEVGVKLGRARRVKAAAPTGTSEQAGAGDTGAAGAGEAKTTAVKKTAKPRSKRTPGATAAGEPAAG
ncbi:30S ribosomal protein S19e [archaeon]|nr:30S ribosomal protein S19e [archaeon]